MLAGSDGSAQVLECLESVDFIVCYRHCILKPRIRKIREFETCKRPLARSEAIGEMVSHPVFDKFAAANPSMKKHCFAEEARAIAGCQTAQRIIAATAISEMLKSRE